MLASRVWSWGRAEREIVAPHASAALFWRRAAAPYRALAARLYSRLCASDASPVLSAGAGAPLLKLWALAALDPAAAEGSPSNNGTAAGGFGRARARLARAARRHPALGPSFRVASLTSRLFLEGDERLADEHVTVNDRTNASLLVFSFRSPRLWRRARLTCAPSSRLCANRASARATIRAAYPSQTRFRRRRRAVGRGAGSARGGARPRRRRRGRGPVRGRRRGRERGGRTKVRGEASRDTPGPGAESGASLNALSSFHAAGAGACVAAATSGPRSVAASRFTAMTHVIAARHAHITAVVSSAEAVAASALAAAAYAGSARAEAAAATRARARARSANRSNAYATPSSARASCFLHLAADLRQRAMTRGMTPRWWVRWWR